MNLDNIYILHLSDMTVLRPVLKINPQLCFFLKKPFLVGMITVKF